MPIAQPRGNQCQCIKSRQNKLCPQSFSKVWRSRRVRYASETCLVKRNMAESSEPKGAPVERQFYAEAAYADSIFQDALGDREGSIMALELALEAMPRYAPAILNMGSVLYQPGRVAEGRRLFQSLLSLPKNTTDICQIIDEAGLFLTGFGAYQDGRGSTERP